MSDERNDRSVGRPRCPQTHKAILQATRTLFAHSNLRDLTIEAIAKEAGVGKATIYRWWKTKADLALDACVEDLMPILYLDCEGDPISTIAGHVERSAKAYSGCAGRMIAQVLAEAQYETCVAESFYREYLSRREGALRHLLSRLGITDATEQKLIAEQLYGPIFFRLILRHAPLDDDFAKAMHDYATARLSAAERRVKEQSAERKCG